MREFTLSHSSSRRTTHSTHLLRLRSQDSRIADMGFYSSWTKLWDVTLSEDREQCRTKVEHPPICVCPSNHRRPEDPRRDCLKTKRHRMSPETQRCCYSTYTVTCYSSPLSAICPQLRIVENIIRRHHREPAACSVPVALLLQSV